MIEDRLDIGDLAIEIVAARPQADFLALDIGIVEHQMGPAVGLDRGPPEIGILIIGEGGADRMPSLADPFPAAAQLADIAGHRLKGQGHAHILLAIGIAARCP